MRGIIIGAAPGFDPELLKSHVRPEDYVICADGGYDYALRAGIVPNVFLGDMDSVHSQDISASRVIRLSPQKDDTDSYTAARVGLEAGCRRMGENCRTGYRMRTAEALYDPLAPERLVLLSDRSIGGNGGFRKGLPI